MFLSERFLHFTVKDGLPNDTINGILSDDRGILWLSTNIGVSRFDTVRKVFRNYDVDDGLQGKEFNPKAAYKSTSGELFFGGLNGFNRFYAVEVKDNSHVPPVVLTGIKKFIRRQPGDEFNHKDV